MKFGQTEFDSSTTLATVSALSVIQEKEQIQTIESTGSEMVILTKQGTAYIDSLWVSHCIFSWLFWV